MDTFTAQSARDYIYSLPLGQTDVATPFWPQLDGHIAIRDVPGDVSVNWGNPEAFPGGLVPMTGEMLAMTLVLKDTNELIIPLTDREHVVKTLGLSVLMPVINAINDFLGLGDATKTALENAKKNSETTQTNSSGTN